MFNLDEAIRSWCRSVHTMNPFSTARQAELEDHLRCEIERLVDAGHSEEDAFQQAKVQLGDHQILRAEHAKNRSALLSGFCAVEGRIAQWRAALSPKIAAALQIGIAIVFALAMILSSEFFESARHQKIACNVLLAVYAIPFTFLCMPSNRCGDKRSKTC